MTTTKQRIIVLVLAALMAAFALFAGTATMGPVDDADAAKAGDTE
jgi:hypothetical protein